MSIILIVICILIGLWIISALMKVLTMPGFVILFFVVLIAVVLIANSTPA